MQQEGYEQDATQPNMDYFVLDSSVSDFLGRLDLRAEYYDLRHGSHCDGDRHRQYNDKGKQRSDDKHNRRRHV